MKRSLMLCSTVVVALAASACQDSATLPTSASIKPAASARSSAALPGVQLDRGRISPRSSLRVADRYSAFVAGHAINPSDYICQESTPVTDWYIGEVVNFIT